MKTILTRYAHVHIGYALKELRTWLNEREYKEFKEKAQHLNTTCYGLVKKLVKEFLEDKRAIAMCVCVLVLNYTLYATTYILVR